MSGLERPCAPDAGAGSSPGGDSGTSWGAFCLANDAVFEWSVGLFESVRSLAPELPLLVIPFDDRQDRLLHLVERYGYDYFVPRELEQLDRLGRRFYPSEEFAARGFRKLAAFSGPFAHFFFCDSDVVLLTRLAALREEVDRSQVDLVHFDTDLDQVYRQGVLRDRMVADCDARGFNCGLFVGRQGAVPPERLAAVLDDLDGEWPELLVPNAEQPFLNLFADRVGLTKRAAHEMVPDYCSTCWPAVGSIELDGGVYRLRNSGRWDDGRRMFFAHWAGFSLGPTIPNRHLYARYRRLAEVRLGSLDPE